MGMYSIFVDDKFSVLSPEQVEQALSNHFGWEPGSFSASKVLFSDDSIATAVALPKHVTETLELLNQIDQALMNQLTSIKSDPNGSVNYQKNFDVSLFDNGFFRYESLIRYWENFGDYKMAAFTLKELVQIKKIRDQYRLTGDLDQLYHDMMHLDTAVRDEFHEVVERFRSRC